MIKYGVLVVLLLLSVACDLKSSRIRNIYVISASLAGLLINTCFYKLPGLRNSIMGIVMPILIFGIFFYIKMIGAGDIKLFSAIGALLGWQYVLYIIAYSFLFAGGFALTALIKKSQLKSTFLAFYQDIKICLFSKGELLIQNMGGRHTIRLSPAIAIGTCLQAVLSLF